MNIAAVDFQQQKLVVIQSAIQRAAKMVDDSAYLDLDGKRELLNLTQLNQRYDKELAALQALQP
jgi:hypothetical protein